MKLLLDTCIWGGAVPELRAGGHDVVWAGDWQQDPGDDEILAIAHREQRSWPGLSRHAQRRLGAWP